MGSGRIVSYRDLEVWQEAMARVERSYALTNRFPDSERFGLTTPFRRASVSIASRIAEGHARRTRQAYLGYVHVAAGSRAELEAQLDLAVRVGLSGEKEPAECRESVALAGRLLPGLTRAVEQRPQPRTPSP
jgi:four helix bundle protein